MTIVQLSTLRNDTQKFIGRSSIEILGSKAGVGMRVIDNLLTENYNAIEERHLKMIHAVVKSEITSGLYRTSDFAAFLNATEMAIKHRKMIGITGGTGTGKSFMSQAIAKKDNVFYWNCHLIKNPRVFFEQLLINMRMPTYGNISEMIERVAKGFNELDNPLLIIDEADKMHKHIRAAIHTLRDRTINNLGMILIGMPALKNELLRGKEEGKQGFAEFWRRVNLWHHLEGLQPEEIKKVLHDNGITTAEAQREFRQYKSFGELVNAIQLFKILNN